MDKLRDGINKIVKSSRYGTMLPNVKLEEAYDDYNDYFANGEPITHSEREFNLATSNDRPLYEHLRANRPALRDRINKGEDYAKVLNELRRISKYDGWNPRNVRKDYLMRILNDDEWWSD